MSFKEIWTDEARFTFNKIVLNFSQFSSAKRTTEFIDRVAEVIHYLRENPEMYEVSDRRKEIRRCVVVPEISLYYKLEQQTIVLLNFWDNRSDPKNLVL